MDRSCTVDILNELLAFEQQNLAGRLLESTVFVTAPSIDDWNVVRQIAQASCEHEGWLAEKILALDGVPGLRFGSTNTANLHYQELGRALPRLVAWCENAVDTHMLAAKRVDAEPQAQQVVSRILARHQQALMSVRQLGRQRAAESS